MKPPLQQADVDARFGQLADTGLGDDAILARLHGDFGFGIKVLWKALVHHRGLERREAMRRVLLATRVLRDRPPGPEDRSGNVHDTHCPRCCEPLLRVIPGRTSREEIIAFARHSRIFAGTSAARDGWIHPGLYCPNGCIQQLHSPGLGKFDREGLERNRLARETAGLTVRLITPGTAELDDLKIYVDRNVRRTPLRYAGEAAACETRLCMTIDLEPGPHTVIVRDSHVHQPNRRESNRIEFHVQPGQHPEFWLSADIAGFHLQFRPPQDP